MRSGRVSRRQQPSHAKYALHAQRSYRRADGCLYGKGILGRSPTCHRRKYVGTIGKAHNQGFSRDNAVDDTIRCPLSTLSGGNASAGPHERLLPCGGKALMNAYYSAALKLCIGVLYNAEVEELHI